MSLRLRVATLNIHKGLSLFNRRMVIHELREGLRKLEADIVFLQEVQGLHEKNALRFGAWPRAAQHEFLADEGLARVESEARATETDAVLLHHLGAVAIRKHLDIARAGDRPVGVVRMQHRRTEEHDHAIAGQLVEHGLVFPQHLKEAIEVSVDDRRELLDGRLREEGRGVLEIAHHRS